MFRKLKPLLKSFLMGNILSLCLLSIDFVNRIWHPHLGGANTTSEFMLCLVMFILPFINNNKHFFIISVVILFIGMIELIYFGYFGTPVSPMDISLFFINMNETLQAFSQMIEIIYFPLLVILLASGVFYISHRILIERMRYRYTWLILILIIGLPVYPIIKVQLFHHGIRQDPNRSIGDFPDMANSLWISAQKTLIYYFVYTLPHQLIFHHHINEIIASTPSVRKNAPKLNIILVMGESLTSKHVSAYNYPRNTTPFLNSLKYRNNVILKNGISAGVCTDVSLSMFFNSVFQPDAAPQIASTHRNLFKMAKENGFETYFISAQGTFFLNMIKSYLLLKFIDHFADASFFGASPKANVLDENLLSYFKKQNFHKPVFMVLHQRGSHFPYIDRFPQKYAVFTSKENTNQTQQINNYDNSVRYTDVLLAKLTKAIRHKTHRPSILIITADHGESLGENGIYGHNNLREMEQFQVPIIFIALNGAKLDFLKQKDRQDINSQYMSHYELSKVIAYLLGYQINQFSTQKTLGYVVTGNSLMGLAGYDKISISPAGQLINSYH